MYLWKQNKSFFQRDVKFYENVFPFKKDIHKHDTSDNLNQNEVNHLKIFDLNLDENTPIVPNDDVRGKNSSFDRDGGIDPHLGGPVSHLNNPIVLIAYESFNPTS